MPLEVANFINQLDPANPAAPDLLADTDNHLRLIKQVIKNCFPAVSGPVTVSHHTLNGAVPIGGIIMWGGALTTIPAGWVLCAGQTVTRSDNGASLAVPDLRRRFVVGAELDGAQPAAPDPRYAVGHTGGSLTPAGTTDTVGAHAHGGWTDAQGNHSHGGATLGHTLNINQIPEHEHTIGYSNNVSVNTGGYGFLRGARQALSNAFSETKGGSQPHAHGIQVDGNHAHNVATDSQGNHAHVVTVTDGRPPFYALAYIMKV